MANDYAILAPPSIDLATFRSILSRAGSPAAPEAAGLYGAAVSRGVDPAVFLAIFQHESNFGRAGVAVSSHNPGNLRTAPAEFGGTKRGGFEYFTTWTQGAQATAALLASGLYGGSAGYNTVRKLPFRWAPSSDGNAPASYGSSLVHSINAWTGGKLTPTPSQPATKAGPVAKAAKVAPMTGTPKVNAGSSLAPVILLGLGAAAVILIVLLMVKAAGPSDVIE